MVLLLISDCSSSWQCRHKRSLEETPLRNYVCCPLDCAYCNGLLIDDSPNILAFNLATGTRTALIMLTVLMFVSAGLLYYFTRTTRICRNLVKTEGIQLPTKMTKQWGLILATFTLTAVYLPISTMAIHVLVWSDDLWAVPNPYTNATTNPPQVAPLGPADEYRDPLDFCYTTTMKRNEINLAPSLVILSVIVIASVGLSCSFHFCTKSLSPADHLVPCCTSPDHPTIRAKGRSVL